MWKFWRRRNRLTHEQMDLRQVHRLNREVVSTILAEVGEPILLAVLAKMKENREEKGESDYTSLGEIWLEAKKKYRSLSRR